MWDYEDRLNARGRYSPRNRYRRQAWALRNAVEALALVAAWAVILYAVSSNMQR
jgi:hypothetical protein